MSHDTFTFADYKFDPATKTLTLHYAYDSVSFQETYQFDFDFVKYDEAVLDRAIQQLFFIAGVSYYKVYLPANIEVHAGQIDRPLAKFLDETYQRGLGELFYVNKLDPRRPIRFPATSETDLPQLPTHTGQGMLIGIGGGKDSLVTVEQLRGRDAKLATFSVNHRPQLTPLVKRIGLPHYWVERSWDTQLLELNGAPDTYNGHVPISAILGAAGLVTAVLAGMRDVVVSNEQSANEPTLQYDGVAINHQYSKSEEFEANYQTILHQHFGNSLRYYSFLRPLSELHIAELFADNGFERYHDVFSSCNRAFTHDSDRMYWDAKCSKCCFVFLALTPFVPREQLEAVFHGKNLLLIPALEPTYRQLLGIEGDKPLDCVGEIKESRTAMQLAFEKYPELQAKYTFDVPADYRYDGLFSHHMPDEIYKLLST